MSRFKVSASGTQAVVSPFPRAFTARFAGDMSVEGKLPKFSCCVLGTSAIELVRLQPSIQYKWWGAPFRIGRIPVYAALCPFWHGLSACFEPFERLLSPALRLAIPARFKKLSGALRSDGAANDGVSLSLNTAGTVVG